MIIAVRIKSSQQVRFINHQRTFISQFAPEFTVPPLAGSIVNARLGVGYDARIAFQNV
jgi:hypothetical protein